MADIFGLPVPDSVLAGYNAADLNGRAQILTFLGRPDMIPWAQAAWVQETYGYLGGIMNIPEISNLLTRAAREGWSETRIQGALTATNYWKTHSAAQRNWLQLRGSDPASAEKMVTDAVTSITAIAQAQGVEISKTRIREIAKKIASSGITDQNQITRMIVAEARYTGEGSTVGALQASQSQILARAREYGIRLTDRVAFDWAKRISGGTADAATVDEFLRDQAKARFANSPQMLQALDQGLTVRTAMDPQIAEIAQSLEIDPDTIDFTDARWAPLLEQVDGGVFRPMTTGEAGKFARSQEEFKTTQGARAQGASIGQTILQAFGKAAA